MEDYATLIRRNEAMELLGQFKDDLVMNQLLNYANYVLIGGFQADTPEALPVADFDLFFYLKTVEQFCQDQPLLKRMLAGEEEIIKYRFRFRYNWKQVSHQGFPVKFLMYPELIDGLFFNEPDHFEMIFRKVFLRQTNEFVRGEEALQLLYSVEDPTTKRLLVHVTNNLLMYAPSSGQPPAAPFDLYFFMRAMKTFCSDHLFLTKVLNGEDLRWFSVA